MSKCSSKDSSVSETVACSLRTLPITVSGSSNSTNNPKKKLKILSNIKAFVKTTSNEKQALDAQVACFVYATNSSFNLVENAEFLKFTAFLHPGY